MQVLTDEQWSVLEPLLDAVRPWAPQPIRHGARALVRVMRSRPGPSPDWIGRLLQRRPVNVAVMAQANRTARIAPRTTTFHPALLKKDCHPFHVSLNGCTPLY
jgi:hypothetical protein